MQRVGLISAFVGFLRGFATVLIINELSRGWKY